MSKLQLFCFTYAGGNAHFFDEIEKDLPALEFVKLEYAGHGTRHKESFYKDFFELSHDIFFKLKNTYNGGPYALFGYSMGVITLIEVLKLVEKDLDIPNPERVFLAAHEPQTKAELVGFSDDELEDWIKQRTIRFGAVPEKLINNKSFWRIYLPIYRADYSIIADYRFKKIDFCSVIPATVFYSKTDTPFADISEWKNYFFCICEFFEFEGPHFFIQQHHKEMANIIYSRIFVN